MIITELMGGMGNQMFQYALGRHLSLKNDTPLQLDAGYLLDRRPREGFVFRNYDLDIFNVDVQFASKRISDTYGVYRGRISSRLNKIFFKPLRYKKEANMRFDPQLLNESDNLYLSGFWQSEKYFSSIEEVIRNDFNFRTPISKNARELQQKIRGTNSVCLNVRRGDFVSNPVHGTMGTDYYSQAVSSLKGDIGEPVVFVFSDEIEWCKDNLRIESETHFVTHEYAGHKFRDYLELMSSCKNFIIPNSSFAWWGAWLSTFENKIIIAPKVWFQDSSLNFQDVVPENWRRI
jgi:hypothetical protein